MTSRTWWPSIRVCQRQRRPPESSAPGPRQLTARPAALPFTLAADEDDACAANTISFSIPNATIRLTPPTDTNEVGTTHDITCHIRIHNGGSGTPFQNAPAGTNCDGDISGVGSFITGGVADDDDCATVGTTGQCTLTITSAVTGQSIVSACTEEMAPPGGLTVNNVQLSRCTDGLQVAPVGCPDDPDPGGPQCINGLPVEKFWVDAEILLAPPQDANAVNDPHTFTCHIRIDIGDGNGFVDAPDGTLCDLDKVSGPGDFTPTTNDDQCLVNGGDGNCTVTFTSPTTGITVVKACTEENQPPPPANAGLTVTATNMIGVALSRCTESLLVPPTSPGNCTPIATEGPNDAVKCWVNAEILLSPPQDANEINDPHVFTCHIRIDIGDGNGFVNAPNNTLCDLDKVSGPGDFTPTTDDDFCLVDGGDGNCTVTFTSPTTGITVVKACTEEIQAMPGLTVLGVPLTRCTANLPVAPTSPTKLHADRGRRPERRSQVLGQRRDPALAAARLERPEPAARLHLPHPDRHRQRRWLRQRPRRHELRPRHHRCRWFQPRG